MVSGGFQHDVGLDGFDGLGVGGQDGARRPDGPGDLEGSFMHVDGDDFGCAGALGHCHDEAADRAAADHQDPLAGEVACLGDGVPGDAGGFGEGGCAQRAARRGAAGASGRAGRNTG